MAARRPGNRAAARDSAEEIVQLRESLGRLRVRLARIGEITQEFNTLDLDRIAQAATRRMSEFLGARSSSLYLYDYAGDELALKAATHGYPLAEKIALKHAKHTVMGLAVASLAPVRVDGFAAWEKAHRLRIERPFASKYAGETCLSLPLHTASFVVGVLNFADKEGGFDPEEDVPAAEQLGRILAMAVRNCRLFREVQNQAHTDALTGLRNYRAFHETLRTEMHRSSRYGRPLGLVMLDVDSFKELNDRFGHPAGDAALARLGSLIRDALRREDFAARYGGDEIAILLPETPPDGCLSVVRRLMGSVQGARCLHEGRRLPLSISVGVAFFKPEMTAAQFVEAADQALYRAKQAGKNRFAVLGEKT
jgi:diguanylate cyclase (GGDEF)-like protein